MTQEIDVTPSVVEFDDIVDDRYGGKAAGLAELRRLGLPVPTGFVIAAGVSTPTCRGNRWPG